MASSTGPKRALFADESDGGDSDDGGAELKVNEEYAKRFEHNKKREELQRLEEKYKSKRPGRGAQDDGDEGSDSSSDETEDEHGFLVTADLDAEISATLQAIKNKDPRIYDKDAVFYKPVDAEGEAGAVPRAKKEKPVTIQDYQRERYMRGEVGEPDVDEGAPRTYAQEQDELKKSILSEIRAAAADGDSDDDGETLVKPKDSQVPLVNGVHASRAAALKLTELDVAKADKDPDGFLNRFLTSRAWVEDDGREWDAFESDDEEGNDNDLAEEFENAYNMRFEDPEKSNEVLKSYSRALAASRSVRREEATGRKKRRVLEKERKEEEKKERQEERARLRRLRVEEAAEKLEKIKKAAGMSGKSLKGEDDWIKLLDEAWDNEKWEEEMQQKFGADYYAEEDQLPEVEEDDDDDDGDDDNDRGGTSKKRKPKKPQWDDDVDINDIVPGFEDDDRPRITLTDSDDDNQVADASRKRPVPSEADEVEEDDIDIERPSKKRKSGKDHRKERAEAKRHARQELSKIETLVDIKMNLDDPSILAAPSASASTNPERHQKRPASTPAVAPFRYRETSPTTFGLTARDILLAPSDAALNQFAGLKKLATFREAEKKRKDRKRLGKKARLRQWRRETFGEAFELSGPTFGFGEDGGGGGGGSEGAEHEMAVEKPEDGAAGVESGAGKKKRKRNKVKKRRSRGGGKEAAAEVAEG